MQLRVKSSILILTFLISSCDGEPPKSKIENPLAGHAEALEKAKNVEKQLLDQHNKAMEKVN